MSEVGEWDRITVVVSVWCNQLFVCVCVCVCTCTDRCLCEDLLDPRTYRVRTSWESGDIMASAHFLTHFQWAGLELKTWLGLELGQGDGWGSGKGLGNANEVQGVFRSTRLGVHVLLHFLYLVLLCTAAISLVLKDFVMCVKSEWSLHLHGCRVCRWRTSRRGHVRLLPAASGLCSQSRVSASLQAAAVSLTTRHEAKLKLTVTVSGRVSWSLRVGAELFLFFLLLFFTVSEELSPFTTAALLSGSACAEERGPDYFLVYHVTKYPPRKFHLCSFSFLCIVILVHRCCCNLCFE